MTDKTPIEKAAEESAEAVVQAIMPHVSWDIDAADLVDTVRPIIEQCHRRVLSEEVPEKFFARFKWKWLYKLHVLLGLWLIAAGHNQCRRAIGLRDDTEEA